MVTALALRDDATLQDCLELALQAPTGSLRRDWHIVVSTDPEQCRAVGTIYQEPGRHKPFDQFVHLNG